jgi:hypothetical protein
MAVEEVAAKSLDLIKTRGWVCWKCHNMDREIITIVRNRLPSGFVPNSYPKYTVDELKEFCESSVLKLVNEAVKLGGKIDTEN